MPNLMKVVLVELTDETSKVAMFEVFRENRLSEFLVLTRKQVNIWLQKADDYIACRTKDRKSRDIDLPREQQSCRLGHPIELLRYIGDLPASYV